MCLIPVPFLFFYLEVIRQRASTDIDAMHAALHKSTAAVWQDMRVGVSAVNDQTARVGLTGCRAGAVVTRCFICTQRAGWYNGEGNVTDMSVNGEEAVIL